ncbi:MAG: hypothetical protein CMN25_04345 [Salinicola sp.]|uniref:hypothetical protein n=1 Tax=Salinicola sp. TaxID=1978524 RepID=UPI000C89E3AD|nr:hypothetical protein [Salinicola sp.]MAM56546.1 hypothetical protein [Salinicola sp.]NRB55802.1 hypothetical protein [Salinicola sp.]
MNARDYLAKQGIALDKEQDKPQSLEEKAWARAREAAEHGPRSGTPHDWEDWERHHEELASDSRSIHAKVSKTRSNDEDAKGRH